MWLLIAFIGVPLIEIALFIQIGGAIGLWSTLAIVVLTAVLGTFMVKQQGAMAISDLRNQMTGMKDPTEAHPAHHSQGGGPVIDGEFEDLTAGPDPQAEPRRTQGPSGWTDSEQKD